MVAWRRRAKAFAMAIISLATLNLGEAENRLTRFMKRASQKKLLEYGFALLCVVCAFGVTPFFPALKQRGLLGLLMAGVALSAWWGGFGPALFGLAVSTFVTAWWVLPPTDSIR